MGEVYSIILGDQGPGRQEAAGARRQAPGASLTSGFRLLAFYWLL
jgi:hypothetical protein